MFGFSFDFSFGFSLDFWSALSISALLGLLSPFSPRLLVRLASLEGFIESASGFESAVLHCRLPSALFLAGGSFALDSAFAFGFGFALAPAFALGLDLALARDRDEALWGFSLSSDSLSSLASLSSLGSASVDAPTGFENCERKARPPRRLRPASCDRIRCDSLFPFASCFTPLLEPSFEALSLEALSADTPSFEAPFAVSFKADLAVFDGSLLFGSVSLVVVFVSFFVSSSSSNGFSARFSSFTIASFDSFFLSSSSLLPSASISPVSTFAAVFALLGVVCSEAKASSAAD